MKFVAATTLLFAVLAIAKPYPNPHPDAAPAFLDDAPITAPKFDVRAEALVLDSRASGSSSGGGGGGGKGGSSGSSGGSGGTSGGKSGGKGNSGGTSGGSTNSAATKGGNSAAISLSPNRIIEVGALSLGVLFLI